MIVRPHNKQGTFFSQHLLVIGSRNVARFPKARARVGGGWIEALLGRPMAVAVAVAISDDDHKEFH